MKNTRNPGPKKGAIWIKAKSAQFLYDSDDDVDIEDGDYDAFDGDDDGAFYDYDDDSFDDDEDDDYDAFDDDDDDDDDFDDDEYDDNDDEDAGDSHAHGTCPPIESHTECKVNKWQSWWW